jgi:hypothetical protein
MTINGNIRRIDLLMPGNCIYYCCSMDNISYQRKQEPNIAFIFFPNIIHKMETPKIVKDLLEKIGKEFSDMTDESFQSRMEKESKEDLLKVKDYLISTRDFYKRILLEEYRKSHPNSFRYKEADEKIAQINVKGKLLKSILDLK